MVSYRAATSVIAVVTRMRTSVTFDLLLIGLAFTLGCFDPISYLTSETKTMQKADWQIVGDAVQSILAVHGKNVDVSTIPEAQRNIVLVNYAHYRIGNGGFSAFLSSDLTGDPTYALTVSAHSSVGADAGADAVKRALAVFANSTPPASGDERSRIYSEHYSLDDIFSKRETPDTLYFASLDLTMSILAEYVKRNAEKLP